MPEINVNIKSAAAKKKNIKTIAIHYPDGITDVRGLIQATVAWCVGDYNERRENSELLTALTSQEIEDRASQGKVSFGVNYGNKSADLSQATADALEAFADGTVVIFADGRRLESLDEAVDPASIMELTFVRMTMLAGRMW